MALHNFLFVLLLTYAYFITISPSSCSIMHLEKLVNKYKTPSKFSSLGYELFDVPMYNVKFKKLWSCLRDVVC